MNIKPNVVVVALALSLGAVGTAAAQPPNEPASVIGPEVGSLRTELRRGLDQVRLEGQPEPYFAELRIVRLEMLSLEGSYGGVVTDLLERQAAATITVRVGNANIDSSAFLGLPSSVTLTLPLDPDAGMSRKRLWLGFDGSFRQAVSAYEAKQSALDRMAGDPLPPSMSKFPGQPPSRLAWNVGDPKPPPMEIDRAGLRKLVADLSGRFDAHPNVDEGGVAMALMRTHELVLNTDGVTVGWAKDRAFLATAAVARADEGMLLDHGDAILLQSLPAPADLRAKGEAMVDRVLDQLDELVAAPLPDEDYDGPVLFEAPAAAQLLASTVAPHASGEPPPVAEFGRVLELEPYWQERLGKSVMPEWIDVVDDPRAPGFGHYDLDAEGVPAQRLELVKKGQLSDLFMTRTPNAVVTESNGHARSAAALTVGPAPSNLVLTTRRRGKTKAQLEKELLRRAHDDGYEYAYVIELLRDGGVLGPVPRDSAAVYSSGRKVPMPVPARLWRIDASGTRTLLRGALISPASMRVLRRIRDVGDTSAVVPMRIASGMTGGFAADVGLGGLLSQTVDVQVETPALLVDGLEVLVERGEYERPPILEHPLRRR